MDFEFSPDTLMLRDMLRRFVQKDARPLEMKYFSAGALAPEERARLRQAVEQLGLWGITVPERFGGGGLDMVTACVLEEELGGTFVPIEIGEVPALLYECTGDQIARYLEPALAGKRQVVWGAREPGSLRPEEWTTKAVAESGGFVLQGQKSLPAGPGPDDFFVVLARTPEGQTAFLLEPGALGLAISAPGAAGARNGRIVLSLDNAHVQAGAVLGQPGKALATGGEEAPRRWIRLGARYVGMVERLKSMASEHARDWVALGGPLSVRPAVQRMLADISAEVESARWLVYHAAWMADKGEAVRVAAAHVRLFTGEILQQAIDRVTMIYGGPGPSTEILPQRMARSLVPSDTLELALEYARAVITAQVLAAGSER